MLYDFKVIFWGISGGVAVQPGASHLERAEDLQDKQTQKDGSSSA